MCNYIDLLVVDEAGQTSPEIAAASFSLAKKAVIVGAERKVILFSSVYGSEDGCYFINRAPDLMNVAVSRAKDSFLVFGDKECLTGGEKTAAGLLKKMVFVEGEELC